MGTERHSIYLIVLNLFLFSLLRMKPYYVNQESESCEKILDLSANTVKEFELAIGLQLKGLNISEPNSLKGRGACLPLQSHRYKEKTNLSNLLKLFSSGLFRILYIVDLKNGLIRAFFIFFNLF